MADLSFELKDHHDFLSKLEAEYADLEQNPLSSRHAINFAMTAYHLCEWVWEHETLVNTNPSFQKRMDFYSAVNQACPPIGFMRDVTNGSKHTKITRGVPVVQATGVHEGPFDHTFDFTFPTTSLVLRMVDGSERHFLNDATAARDFWQQFFASGFRI